jgi:L-threonylcarbamoyladenylate synthase
MARILLPTPDSLTLAAETIRIGGLVAFPTETVYGLGANALDPDAVQRIFTAKGRPATNPVIVHISDAADLGRLAEEVPAAAPLIDRFWPGPLTLVFVKKPSVPDIVTAGGPTVAVRMPDHPVALALLRAAGTPIAAPSANRSEQLSPTRAEHVAASLGDTVDMVLDGGPCSVGLESTVLDVTVWPPRILRPGMVTAADIESVLDIAPAEGPAAISTASGHPVAAPADDIQSGARSDLPDSISADIARSPGQMTRHYAPRKPLTVTTDAAAAVIAAGGPAAVLVLGDAPAGLPNAPHIITMPADPDRYAAALYAALHDADQSSAAAIIVEAVPDGPRWRAVRDRLSRAAAKA